ncbi:hypothetical protein Btru_018265 [Bulinus truncatus]|nr:hypothetical protein Btru_018265 [Bulinus truncatus]
MFHGLMFYRLLFYGLLFYRLLFYRLLFYGLLFYGLLFHGLLFHGLLFHGLLFHGFLIHRRLFYGRLHAWSQLGTCLGATGALPHRLHPLGKALLVLLVNLVTVGFSQADGPSLGDLLVIQCPAERPFKCLPYGNCCGGDQFCHEGICASCFPRDVSDEDLLTWCREVGQHDVTQMRHASCRAACFFKFNVTDLVQYEAFSDCPAERPKKCSAGQCCGEIQYCSGQDCVPCFPSGLSKLQLASWCRQKVNSNSSSDGHPSCRFACHAVFTPEQLSKIDDSVDPWMIAFLVMCGFVVVCLVADVTCPDWGRNVLKLMRSKTTRKIEKDHVEFSPVSNGQYLSAPVSNGHSVNVLLERNLSIEVKNQEIV